MQRILTLLTLTVTLSLLPVQTAFASPQADVTNDQATISFPLTVTISAQISSTSNITSILLEYGTEQLTCGEVIAKAFPQFTPGKTVNVEWTWDMRQSGSLPPGATIWWRWRYIDETGREAISNQQTVTWLDNVHPWKTITSGTLRLHWYGIENAFAQDLLNTGLEGLKRSEEESGLKTDSLIELYIYPNYIDLQEAILFEPSWTGGRAFPDHNIVILGLSQYISDYNRNVVVHELTHVVIGNFTFSCLGGVPTWLNEGLAVYSESGLDTESQQQLDEAIQDNTLLSVRSLSAGFSEVPSKAYLSYSQSYSIVKFLIETYGRNEMTGLLTKLRDGATIDDALLDVYGFDVEGLEDAWRIGIGAAPRSVSAEATVQPTPTFVPTIVPISGAPLVTQISTPTAIPTSSINQAPITQPSATRNLPPLWLTAFLLGSCCILILLLGVIILGFVLRRNNRKGGDNVQ